MPAVGSGGLHRPVGKEERETVIRLSLLGRDDDNILDEHVRIGGVDVLAGE